MTHRMASAERVQSPIFESTRSPRNPLQKSTITADSNNDRSVVILVKSYDPILVIPDDINSVRNKHYKTTFLFRSCLALKAFGP